MIKCVDDIKEMVKGEQSKRVMLVLDRRHSPSPPSKDTDAEQKGDEEKQSEQKPLKKGKSKFFGRFKRNKSKKEKETAAKDLKQKPKVAKDAKEKAKAVLHHGTEDDK